MLIEYNEWINSYIVIDISIYLSVAVWEVL